MGILNRTKQIGVLSVGFSKSMPTGAFVDISDISGQLSSDMYGLLWGQYFLYVIKEIGEKKEVEKFKQAFSRWARQHSRTISPQGLSDKTFEELPYTTYLVGSLETARDAEVPIDRLCFSEIHENKRGSIPFLYKSMFSPELTPETGLSSIVCLARWILDRDSSFGDKLPYYALALIERLDLGDKFHFIKTFRKADKLPAECAHHAHDAAVEGHQRMLEDAKVQRVEVSCPKCGKNHALPSGKSGTVKCLNKDCNHQFATVT